MSLQESWERALQKTEIIRYRIRQLPTFEATHMPYIFLAESSINMGDSVVRKGEIVVEKPAIILPDNMPKFEGFEIEKDFPSGEDYLNNFFLVRGIRFPSLKYNNRVDTLDIFEGKLQKAIDHYSDELKKKEDTATGLVVGPENTWQFSVIIFICHQIMRQLDGDIQRLLDSYRKRE